MLCFINFIQIWRTFISHQRHSNTAAYSNYLISLKISLSYGGEGRGGSKVPLAVRRDGHGVFRTILWTSITGWHWGEQCCTPHQSLTLPHPITNPPTHPALHTGRVRALSKSESCSLMTVMAEDGSVNGERKSAVSARARNFDVWNVTARQSAVKKGPPEYFIAHCKSICTGEAEASMKADSVRLKLVCATFTRMRDNPDYSNVTVSWRLIIWLRVCLHPATSRPLPSVLDELPRGCAQF